MNFTAYMNDKLISRLIIGNHIDFNPGNLALEYREADLWKSGYIRDIIELHLLKTRHRPIRTDKMLT